MARTELIESHQYERRILIATIGLHPQILTEILYAISVQSDRPFVPTEIHIITTEEGRVVIEEKLLSKKNNILKKFCSEYGLPNLTKALKIGDICVLKDDENSPLRDISDQEENVAAANMIVPIVQKLSEDPDAALYVFLSGGRKTMGFLLGYALSLYGRRQDKLCHVHVKSELAYHPDFYYPPSAPRILTYDTGQEVNTADVNITLVDIPFVRIRSGLPSELLQGPGRFSEAVNDFESSLVKPEILIDSANHILSLHGVRITLQPLRFAFYVWLAQRRKNNDGANADGAVHWSEVNSGDIKQLLSIYRNGKNVSEDKYHYQLQKFSDGIERDVFEENKSRINATFKKELGFLSQLYEIQKKGFVESRHKGRKLQRVGLDLNPSEICFCSLD